MGYTRFALRKDERLLMSGPANKWQIIGSKGGMLFLTNKRIVFQAHAFNFGSKYDEYELSQIQTQGKTVNIKTTSNWISFNISLYTKFGEKLSFVVTRRQKDEWIRQIKNAVTSYVRATVFVPENIPKAEVQKVKAQIDVVQCEGCGAFIVVTRGNITKCGYCDRPTILH